METLAKLFGNELKAKIIKLFIFNQEKIFSTKEIGKRTKSTVTKVRREVSVLEKIGLLKKRVVKNRNGYIVNQNFKYLTALKNFLSNFESLGPKELIRKFGRAGSIKLLITSGVFIQDSESRADILIVGDSINKSKLENTIKTMESELGKELKYACFSTDEFKYRLSMYDKLTRDILDYPHNKVLDKLGIE